MRRAPTGNDFASSSAAGPGARHSANPLLGLQRKIGNRATGQLLARVPATKDLGTVRVGKLPAIKILGGNASEWAKREPVTLEITSKKGKHSGALERLSNDGRKIPSLKVTMPVNQSGQNLNFGSVELEFSRLRIADYALEGNVETWRAVEIEGLHRTTISHMAGI